MLENTAVRWVLAILAALAIVGLLAYARGPENGFRRDPDHGRAGAPVLSHRPAPPTTTGI